MGSFSSKKRAVSDVGNIRKESNEEMSRGVGDEGFPTTNSSEMAEKTITRGQADAANGGETHAGTSSQQQRTAPKVGQSFSWLASSPVVSNTATKEQKAKGKRPKERSGRAEASNVLKYNNEKYLKSWQQPSSNTTRKAQGDASTSSPSSSPADNNGKYPAKKSNSGYGEVNKEESSQAKQPESGNIGEASTSRGRGVPIGFGAVGKQNSHHESF